MTKSQSPRREGHLSKADRTAGALSVLQRPWARGRDRTSRHRLRWRSGCGCGRRPELGIAAAAWNSLGWLLRQCGRVFTDDVFWPGKEDYRPAWLGSQGCRRSSRPADRKKDRLAEWRFGPANRRLKLADWQLRLCRLATKLADPVRRLADRKQACGLKEQTHETSLQV